MRISSRILPCCLALGLSAASLYGCGSDTNDPGFKMAEDGGQDALDSSAADAPWDHGSDASGTDARLGDVAVYDGGADVHTPADSSTDVPVISDSSVDAAPDASPTSIPVLPHKTDFLTTGCFTHTFAGLDASHRKSCLAGIKNRHYTHFYLYAYNENDYHGPSFNFYADPSTFRSRLQEVKAAGLAPVVWLVPDDAPKMAGRSIAEIEKMMDGLIPKIDGLVSSYVLGLELDEYWNSSRVNALGAHLNSLTSKKIGVHQVQGHWSFAKFFWCDYMVLQYGFGLNKADIANMTKKAIGDLHKPVVAGEYSLKESTAIPLGNAGVAAGSSGFGNGGTP